jgi:hypothetical protein
MARMTEEEADALDEYYTRNLPIIDTTKPGDHGFFTERRDRMFILDELTARIIRTKAEATRQTPEELIAAMVRKDLAVAV